MTDLVGETTSLVGRLHDLPPEDVWIGAGNVFRPRRSSSASKEPWNGINRRGVVPLSIEQVAELLHLRREKVIQMVSENAIPGAFREGVAPVQFDTGGEFREWFGDLIEGRIYLPL